MYIYKMIYTEFRYYLLIVRNTSMYCSDLQTEVKLKQAADKRQMLEQLKRVRKGKSSDLGFLDDDRGKNNSGNNKGMTYV